MSALPGYLANIYITTTPSLPSANEATMNPSADLKTYIITASTHRFLDATQPVTVQTSPNGTSWTTITVGFTIQFVGAVVLFTVAQAAGTQVRFLTLNYYPISFLANANMVDITPTMDIQDSTTFLQTSSPWKTKVATLVGATIKVGKYWADTTLVAYIANRLALSIYTGANPNQRYECYGYLKSDTFKAATNNLLSEDLDIETDGQLYFIAS